MNMFKKIFSFMLYALLLASFSTGCGGGGGGGAADTTNNPSSNPTGTASNPSSNPTGTTITTTPTTTVSGTLKVKVTNYHNANVPNATVVLGDSNGAMITYQTADSNGEVKFINPPVNATVTAANTCVYSGSTGTQYSFAMQHDVNFSTVTLSVYDCNIYSTPSTVKVKVTDIPTGASSISVQPYAYISSITGSTASATINIYPDDVQSDGKISFTAIATDSSGHGLSYGVLTDLTLVSGMTVTIAASQTLNTVQYQINNIPSTAKTITPELLVARKLASFTSSYWGQLVTSGTSTAVAAAFIPGFGDMFGYLVSLQLDQNNDGAIDSAQSIYKWGTTTPADQTFDLSQMPVIASNLTVTGSGTATPTLTWSGTDTSSYLQYISMDISTAVTNTYNQLHVSSYFSPTRTSVIFPQLPDSLAAFRPTAITFFSVGNERSDMFTDYADYQSKLEQYNNGTWTPPTTSISKNSYAWYSSTQALAPAMNKTTAPALRAQKRKFGM